jgi:glucose-6-phosphate isomerase
VNVVEEINDVLERMKQFSRSIRRGERKGYSGKPIKNIINIKDQRI